MKLKQLHEQLQGVKKFHNMNWQQFEQFLKSQNIQLIGSGMFGKVFYSPSWNYVIKVFDKDDGYLKFVNFALENPSRHFPKFMKGPRNLPQFLTRLSSSNERFTVVKMEKLNKLTKEIHEFLGYNLRTLADHYTNNVETPVEIIVDSQVVKFKHTTDVFLKYKQYNLPSLIKVYNQLNILTDEHIRNDLHVGNIMMRDDGTIVITDPFYDIRDLRRDEGMFKALYQLDVAKDSLISGPTRPNQQTQMNLTPIPKQEPVSLNRNRVPKPMKIF